MSYLSSAKASHDVNAGARQLSDGVLRTAQNAVASAQEFGQDAYGRAGSKVRDLRSALEPAIEQFTTRASKIAQRSANLASHTGQRAQQTITRYSDATGRYIADQPVKSILIAAAAGAILAALLVNTASRNRRKQP